MAGLNDLSCPVLRALFGKEGMLSLLARSPVFPAFSKCPAEKGFVMEGSRERIYTDERELERTPGCEK